MQAAALTAAMRKFAPDTVIHLAARTDCEENISVESGYAGITEGPRTCAEGEGAHWVR
jgi:dTDP-4-dehydrorhamnose reductase